jgi:hypothetical protein
MIAARRANCIKALPLAAWLVTASLVTGAHAGERLKNYQLTNGRWFGGRGFHSTTFYAVNGVLTRAKPPRVDEVLDLADGFVVPPFGEAHNHNVEGPWNIDTVIQRYLKDGVFYVKIPNNLRRFSAQILDRLNTPDSIDVAFANGGLTASGGWPVSLYGGVLSTSRYASVVGAVDEGWFDNQAYFLIDTVTDLESKWPTIKAGKPDFIKTYLSNSEDFEKTRTDQRLSIRKGLDPKLLPPIVEKAHRDGLRVSTHVETAADFRHAVNPGVDEINHLPGWFIPVPEHAERTRLTEGDAQLAARRGVVVVTTTVASAFMSNPADYHAQGTGHGQHGAAPHAAHAIPGHQKPSVISTPPFARVVQIHNLRLLHRHGVALAIGSDHAETSLTEALNLYDLLVFDNVTLLQMWCETTARAIFPWRKIGRLEEGYEASFLVLNGDPLEDFTRVKTIRLRFKQGAPLSLPP